MERGGDVPGAVEDGVGSGWVREARAGAREVGEALGVLGGAGVEGRAAGRRVVAGLRRMREAVGRAGQEHAEGGEGGRTVGADDAPALREVAGACMEVLGHPAGVGDVGAAAAGALGAAALALALALAAGEAEGEGEGGGQPKEVRAVARVLGAYVGIGAGDAVLGGVAAAAAGLGAAGRVLAVRGLVCGAPLAAVDGSPSALWGTALPWVVQRCEASAPVTAAAAGDAQLAVEAVSALEAILRRAREGSERRRAEGTGGDTGEAREWVGRAVSSLWPHWDARGAGRGKAARAAVRRAFASLAELVREVGRGGARGCGDGGGENALEHEFNRRVLERPRHRASTLEALAVLGEDLQTANALVTIRPALVREVLELCLAADAQGNHGARTLLQVLLKALWSLSAQRHGGHEDLAAAGWESGWVPALAQLLRDKGSGLGPHACRVIRVALDVHPSSLRTLISHVVLSGEGGSRASALMCVLRSAQTAGLWSPRTGILVPDKEAEDHPQFSVPYEALEQAASAMDESTRLDVLELVCDEAARCPALLSAPEVRLLTFFMPLNLRMGSLPSRQRCVKVLAKLFASVRQAMHKAARELAEREGSGAESDVADHDSVRRGLRRTADFMRWIVQRLASSTYPGASRGRRCLAMELLSLAVSHAPGNMPISCLDGTSGSLSAGITNASVLDDARFVAALIAALSDPLDRQREAVAALLCALPSPLPGLASVGEVQNILAWALNLMRSPRQMEADAGARAFHLVFRHYVLGHGWTMSISNEGGPGGASAAIHSDGGATRDVKVVWELVRGLDGEATQANVDLAASCRGGYCFGNLIALRYALEEVFVSAGAIPGSAVGTGRSEVIPSLETEKATSLRHASCARGKPSLGEVLGRRDEWISAVAGVVASVQRVAEPCLWVMSTKCVVMDEAVAGRSDATSFSASDHNTMTVSFLTCKEVFSVLGTIFDHVPLEGGSGPFLMDATQIESCGYFLVDTLLRFKHNGARNKAAKGLNSLIRAVRRTECKALEALPTRLLDACLGKVQSGRDMDETLRRSAGIPFAVCAILDAQPAHGALVAHAVETLLCIVTRSLASATSMSNDGGADDDGSSVWAPLIHAYDTLRAIFLDGALSSSTETFLCAGLCAGIRGFATPSWQVGTSAGLFFSGLSQRVVGGRDVSERNASERGRGMNVREFFRAYPGMCTTLVDVLESSLTLIAVHNEEGRIPLGAHDGIHPCLYPALVLLCKMEPLDAEEDEHFADPAVRDILHSAIRRVATDSKNFRVRLAAAQCAVNTTLPSKRGSLSLTALLELPESAEAFRRGKIPVKANQVHGLLLMVLCALKSGLPDASDLTPQLCHAMERVEWTATPPDDDDVPGIRVPAIRRAWFLIAEQLMRMDCSSHSSIREFRTCVMRVGLSSLSRPLEPKGSPASVMECPMRKAACAAFLGACDSANGNLSDLVLGFGSDLLEAIVDQFLSDPAYEVRGCMLRRLRSWVRRDNASRALLPASAWRAITNGVLDRAVQEPYHKCRVRALETAVTICRAFAEHDSDACFAVARSPENNASSMGPRWTDLRSRFMSMHHLCKAATHPRERAAALVMMGIVFREFLAVAVLPAVEDGAKAWSEIPDNGRGYVMKFTQMVLPYCRESAPEALRMAALESIVEAGLLRHITANARASSRAVPASSSAAHLLSEYLAAWLTASSLRCWFALIDLLEDDSDEVRRAAAVAACTILDAEELHQEGARGEIDPCHEFLALERSFAYLTHHCSTFTSYRNFLHSFLSPPRNENDEGDGKCTSRDGDFPTVVNSNGNVAESAKEARAERGPRPEVPNDEGATLKMIGTRNLSNSAGETDPNVKWDFFEREDDNLYRESVLLAQLAGMHLGHIVASGASGPVNELDRSAEEWSRHAVGRLARLADRLEVDQIAGLWVASSVNASAVYVDLYRSVMCLLACAPSLRKAVATGESAEQARRRAILGINQILAGDVIETALDALRRLSALKHVHSTALEIMAACISNFDGSGQVLPVDFFLLSA